MIAADKPSISTIGIVGAGAMGRGIAQVAITAGFRVLLYDLRPDAVDDAVKFIRRMLDRAVEKGRMTQESVAEAQHNLYPITSLSGELGSCDVVIEAVIEDLKVKRDLIDFLESEVSSDCILATNTSSLSVAAIARESKSPERIAGMHFFNPVPLIKLVELVSAVSTSSQTIERLEYLATQFGHRPVIVADSPGFLVNHAGRGLITEGLRIVSEGIADYADVDCVMREAAGFKLGPFELMDLTGVDVSLTVMESIYDQFYQEPRYRPSHIVRERVEAGLLGRKTGRGFYVYDSQRRPSNISAPCCDYSAARVWVTAECHELKEAFCELLKTAGVDIDSGDRPHAESICAVIPYGTDATTSTVEKGLDPIRTVAIDPIFGFDKRRSLMVTPLTARKVTDQMVAILSRDGARVTVIRDSPGFIAQRIIAMIVNICSDMAQQRIASPSDIDMAVTSALGYPVGPLALGDKIGPALIVKILNAMLGFYNEPRYRPSPWLLRRAKLNVSLLTAEP